MEFDQSKTNKLKNSLLRTNLYSERRQQRPVGLRTGELCFSKLEVEMGLIFAANYRRGARVNQLGMRMQSMARC